MKKKYAKTKLVIIAVLMLIGLCFSIITFNVPGTSDKFLGFIGAIKSSTELEESYKVTLTIDRTSEVKNSDINDAVDVIYDILTKYVQGYSDVRVVRATSGTDEKIVAYVPNKSLNTTFFDLFGDSAEITGKTSNDVTVITNKNIETAQYTIDGSGNYGVYIKFDKEGTAALIKYGDTLSFTLDGESATPAISNNMLFIYNETISSSQNEASTMPVSLLVGKIGFPMTVETTTIDGMSGAKTSLYLMIATIIFAVGFIAYSIYRHRVLGLITILSTGIYVVAYSFILQSISIASVTLSSYLTMMLSFVIFMIGTEYQIEKMEDLVHTDEKVRMPFAVKNGYKNSLMTLMDLHLVTFTVALTALIAGGRMIDAICINLIVGVAISALLTFVVNYYLIKLLCDIYPGQYKKFNFTKGEIK
jgi:hypothetical protein